MTVQAMSLRRAIMVRLASAVAGAALALCGAALSFAQGVDDFTGDALGILGPKGCDAGERRLRLAHGAPERAHPIGEAASRLAMAANRELDGRLCIEVFPAGAIGDNDTLLKALRAGGAEMAAPHVSAFERYSRAFEIFDLPYLFENPQSAEWFQNSGPGQRLLRELNPTRFKALAFWNAGMRHVAAVRPLLGPGDAKGMRIRVRKNQVMPAMIKASGAIPTPALEKRLPDMLRSGRLDALADSWATIYTGGYHQHLKEMTDSAHNIVTYLLVMSDAAWDDLPLRDRVDLKRLVVREAAQANAESRRIAARSRDKLLRAGATIRKMTPIQREAWLVMSREAWRRFAPQIGQDYVDAALAAKR